MVAWTAEEIAAKRRTDQVLYARWAQRQAVQVERDRRMRRFWLGFGAVFGLAVLAGIASLVWWLSTAVGAAIVLAVLAVAALAAVAVPVGHRCITIVQHWH